MTLNEIEKRLLDAGLHEQSVKRMLNHYKEMNLCYGSGKFQECGLHMGKFCENVGNIIIKELGGQVHASPQLNNILTEIDNLNNNTTVDKMIRVTIPRFLRAAYDLRSQRDAVHTNLETPVSHADAHAGVNLSRWILAELIRVYGSAKHIDEAAALIESLTRQVSPYIDDYEGRRLIMSNKLSVSQEILVHLYNWPAGGLDVSLLNQWIPKVNMNHIRTSVRQLQYKRLVHYDGQNAKITPLGVKEVENILNQIDAELD
jgi:hypothetical protein